MRLIPGGPSTRGLCHTSAAPRSCVFVLLNCLPPLAHLCRPHQGFEHRLADSSPGNTCDFVLGYLSIGTRTPGWRGKREEAGATGAGGCVKGPGEHAEKLLRGPLSGENALRKHEAHDWTSDPILYQRVISTVKIGNAIRAQAQEETASQTSVSLVSQSTQLLKG